MNISQSEKEKLLKKKNVVAVGIGQKWIDGKNTNEPAILVFVESKEKSGDLGSEDLVPSQVEGQITDVVGKSGKFKKLSYTRKIRPVPAGISCGHRLITAGTIGGFFYDKHNHLVMLSNNHVLANENNSRRRDPIYQPGPYDGGNSSHSIGWLKTFKRLRSVNFEDSAIAVVDRKQIVHRMISGAYPKRFYMHPRVGMNVRKTGRTTEVTTGQIIAMHTEVMVEYDMGVLRFRDQIITSYMSEGGDSGSLLVDHRNRVIGLLFAGSDSMTIHNPIVYPLKTYGLSINRKKRR